MEIKINIQDIGNTRAEEFSKIEDARDFLIRLAGEPVEKPEPVEEAPIEEVSEPVEVVEDSPVEEITEETNEENE